MMRARLTCLVAATAIAGLSFATPMDWVRDLASTDPETRETAFNQATDYGPDALVPAAALLDKDDPAIRRAARIALEDLVGQSLATEETRTEAATALCRAALAVRNNAWLLSLLAYAGGEESVAPLLVLLKREGPIAEHARQTLDSILRARDVSNDTRARVTEALAQRLESADTRRAAGLLHTLGTVRTDAAARTLERFLEDDDPALRKAAREGLSACLDLPAARDSDLDDPPLDFQLLRARNLPPKEARAFFEDLLDDAEDPTTLTAAVTGFGLYLEDYRDARDVADLVGHERADVSGAARSALVNWESPDAEEALARLTRRANGAHKIALLEILHARDPETARPYLEDATQARDASVCVAAWILLDVPPPVEATEDFLEVATTNNPLRIPAAETLLGLAGTADEETALEIYARLADGAIDEAIVERARAELRDRGATEAPAQ